MGVRGQLGLRNLQVLERCIGADAEASTSVNRHMVEPDVGNGGDGDEWQHPSPRHVLRAVGRPEGDGGAVTFRYQDYKHIKF
jgi:hypothetical protein